MTNEEIKKISKGFFSKHELECRCGYHTGDDSCKIDFDFLKKLLQLRVLVDRPILINSGYRCEKHLLKSENHASGKAVDIRCLNSSERYEIIKNALKIGVNRIGVHKDFVHIDCNPNNKLEVFWLYEK
jgi:uncharacterized protein YcbK (DUF882 family)